MVIEGQMAKAGEELYRLADLTSIWVIADVAEQDLGQVKHRRARQGQLPRVSRRDLRGRV